MSEWKIIYNEWDADKQPLREALCTLGNGFFATRGAVEESPAGGPHYPGTYLAGGYNRLESHVAGRVIENEDLVNWPNWLRLNFRPEDGGWFDLLSVELLDFYQELDMKKGILKRRVRFRDEQERETTLVSRRLVHMEHPHLAAVEWTLIPENWSGRIQVHSALDGTVTNDGVARYRDLSGQHLENLETGYSGEDSIYLLVRTWQSKIRMAQAARTRAFSDSHRVPLERQTTENQGYIAQNLYLNCETRKAVRIEKVVSIYTSRDRAISEPVLEASKAVSRASNFDDLLNSHQRAWARLWYRSDIQLTGNPEAQKLLRLHIFHLLQTVSFNSIDLDIGVPSRGWHGEAYRGHIFWDELFIFPFLNLRIPELTRSLLMYRYRRLPEAQFAAREAGYKGAMFPWQSGSNGREESQVVHLNPKSGRWGPDHTYLQRHVNASLAYNIWQYYQATADMEFICFYGAEMLLEIARFWASITTYNPDRDRFEINGVVGPDEYHTQYPDSDEPGLKNNAYTNIMAVWVLQCAKWVLDMLDRDRRDELIDQLGIEEEELIRWESIIKKMFVPFHDREIISQFEGYEKLPEFEWKKYRKKYGNIQRLDRILKAENDSPNRYKASKQADVLMLFYLFSSEELQQIFDRLGYDFKPEYILKNIEYYRERSSHGSTLSRLVFSWVLARSDRKQSWEYFMEALMSDFKDIQGGTTPEGIHLGAMAGTVDIIQRCYTALEIREDVLWINPSFPRVITCLQLRIHYRGHWILLHIFQDKLTISFQEGWSREVKIGVKGKVYIFEQGDTREFRM